MSMRVTGLVVGMLAAISSIAAAQDAAVTGPPRVALAFDHGLVTLHAENAPVSMILATWSHLGGTTIVNADRLGGRLVSVDLANVPEKRAIEIVLRGVAGFILAQRDSQSHGASDIGRVLVLPTSSVAAGGTATTTLASSSARPPIQVPAFLKEHFAERGAEGRPPRSQAPGENGAPSGRDPRLPNPALAPGQQRDPRAAPLVMPPPPIPPEQQTPGNAVTQ